MPIQAWLRQGTSNRYYAHCPDLPGCAVSAPTPQLAEETLVRAVRQYLAHYRIAPTHDLVVDFYWAGGKHRRSLPVRPQRFDANALGA